MTMFILVENAKGIKDIEMIDNERDKKIVVKVAERLVMNGTYKEFGYLNLMEKSPLKI